MTGNLNDCRLHAVEGWHEAEFARTAQARATLEQFAKLWLDLAARARTRALGEMGRAPCADQRDLPDRPKVTVGLIAAFQPARSSDAILRRDACISPSSYGQLVHHEINSSAQRPKMSCVAASFRRSLRNLICRYPVYVDRKIEFHHRLGIKRCLDTSPPFGSV